MWNLKTNKLNADADSGFVWRNHLTRVIVQYFKTELKQIHICELSN